MTRSTSGARRASHRSECVGMPNSAATARARSMVPLAIAVTATPGTRRSAGTCTRRANPVPISPTRSVTMSSGRRRCPFRAAPRRTTPRPPRARSRGLESGATRDNRENSAGRPHLDDAAVERQAPGHVLHHVAHADRRAARRYRITPLQQRPRAGRRRSAAASAQPHDDTVPVSRPLQQQSFLPRTAAAAPRARRSFESDGVLARERNEGVHATPLLDALPQAAPGTASARAKNRGSLRGRLARPAGS